jgi:hypothetical protein
MTAAATLSSWLEGLGLEVKETGTHAGDGLSIMPAHDGDPSVAVQRSDPATWEVVHDRRIEGSVLTSDWHAPWDTETPSEVMSRAVREVACGFPLVESETHDEGGDVAIRLRAPVFDEGLTRQAFVLTVSSVLNAARTLDLVMARRAEDRVSWQEFEATSDQRGREQQQLIDRMTEPDTNADADADAEAGAEATEPVAPTPPAPPTPSADDTLPATDWSPSHVVTRRAKAWVQPNPAGARSGELKRRVPVQVIEREGDWAHVVTSNGWTGWIDSRDLKAH